MKKYWIFMGIVLAGVPVALVTVYYVITSCSILQFNLAPYKEAKDILSICGSYLTFAGTFSLGYFGFLKNQEEKLIKYEPKLRLIGADSYRHEQEIKNYRIISFKERKLLSSNEKQNSDMYLFVELEQDSKNMARIVKYRVEKSQWEFNLPNDPTMKSLMKPLKLPKRKRRFVEFDEGKENICILILLPKRQDFVTAYRNVAGIYPGVGYSYCELIITVSFKLKGVSGVRFEKKAPLKLTGLNNGDSKIKCVNLPFSF